MAFDLKDGPRIERRSATATLGIRVVTPFRGMLATRDALIAELATWLDAHGIEPGGPFFLRLHVIDMAADMDIEVGVLDTNHSGDGRVRAGIVPDGEYALLAYTGSSLHANRTLLGWVEEQGRRFDVDENSSTWAARLEILRTDPRTEPRKTRWTTELTFLLSASPVT